MAKVTSNKGFTLLEIFLSLVVISLLTIAFLPVMQKIQLKRNADVAALQIKTISNAAIQYYNLYKQWPRNLDVLNSLLGYQGPTPNPFCSVWRDKAGCVPYKMVSTFDSHYFALSVAVPNTTIARQLINNVSTAYWDSATQSVIAYTTTFRGFTVPPPTGVLFSATSKQLNGNCTSSDAPGQSSTQYSYYIGSPSPFENCVAGTATNPLPYGLIDIANKPANTITAGNNYGSTNGFHASSYLLTDFACPAGTWPTMLLLPLGVFQAVPEISGAPTVYPAVFNYSDAHFITQLKIGNINYEACVSATLGTTDPKSTVGTSARYNGNFFANFGDIVCLPTSAVQRWPDGNNVGACQSSST